MSTVACNPTVFMFLTNLPTSTKEGDEGFEDYETSQWNAVAVQVLKIFSHKCYVSIYDLVLPKSLVSH